MRVVSGIYYSSIKIILESCAKTLKLDSPIAFQSDALSNVLEVVFSFAILN